MKVFYVFLLVLVYEVVRSHGRNHEYNAPTPFKTSVTMPYDEFFLVQQWPESYCRVRVTSKYPCRPYIPTYFTVHGLWAQSMGDPFYCIGRKRINFNPSKLNPKTKSKLKTYWPSLNGRDQAFWGHEYNKHASCIWPFKNDQEKYFSSTLSLAKEFNMTTMLFNAGIFPGKKHRISNIKNAIFLAINVMPTLHCNKANDGTVQLLEIYLCIDKTTFTPQNCRQSVKNCPTQNNGNSQLISFPHA